MANKKLITAGVVIAIVLLIIIFSISIQKQEQIQPSDKIPSQEQIDELLSDNLDEAFAELEEIDFALES
jgi:hypothetical protein